VLDQDNAERAAAREAELNDPSLVGMSKEEHEAFLSSGRGKSKGKGNPSRTGQDEIKLDVVGGGANGDARKS
jgi:hypothetical protein